jgi:hypothetical protein
MCVCVSVRGLCVSVCVGRHARSEHLETRGSHSVKQGRLFIWLGAWQIRKHLLFLWITVSARPACSPANMFHVTVPHKHSLNHASTCTLTHSHAVHTWCHTHRHVHTRILSAHTLSYKHWMQQISWVIFVGQIILWYVSEFSTTSPRLSPAGSQCLE